MSQRKRPADDPAAVEAVDKDRRAVAPKPEERTRERPGSESGIPSVESSRDGCVKVKGLLEPEGRFSRDPQKRTRGSAI